LASQHPNDFAVRELADLLGSRFVFRQARQAIPAALEFLGAAPGADAAQTLEQGLGNGQCLYRDVRERIGLIQIMPPLLPGLLDAFETAPPAAGADSDDPPALGRPRALPGQPAGDEPGTEWDRHEEAIAPDGITSARAGARRRRRSPLAAALVRQEDA